MSEKIKILCIDDEEGIRSALSAIIESQGWVPILAEDMAEAVPLFDKEAPDIVLLDYHMPRINGVSGVKMLRKINAFTPIIVFTINEEQKIADMFMEAGANDFAIKPIKAPDLISRINLHIRLMQSRKVSVSSAFKNMQVNKGISIATLEIIKEVMCQSKEAMTVEEISEKTGLAYQTTYRYLQHMVNEDIVDIKTIYGKIGRPKQWYKIK